jgi:OOP family OmpA-OmpF porin
MITLTGVNFRFDKADLMPESGPYLDKVAAELKANPGLVVEIQGHTDGIGSAAYNLGLSDRRANVVRNYLIKDGVPAGQLTAKGYGLTMPVATNKTKEGRAQNRRTVMMVISKPANMTITGEHSTIEFPHS